ncbi:hypothetical protein JTE90_001818 [Oedothorax gibbosus]|uniref:Uncharacterized protein n=1 Tax=Oedothorax gibbosus TaxID=931172 RepID=A0AAV6TU15_9ARAC|nr:hypothetical protein JTE90_001818 [Oedothorax gibbosus]
MPADRRHKSTRITSYSPTTAKDLHRSIREERRDNSCAHSARGGSRRNIIALNTSVCTRGRSPTRAPHAERPSHNRTTCVGTRERTFDHLWKVPSSGVTLALKGFFIQIINLEKTIRQRKLQLESAFISNL